MCTKADAEELASSGNAVVIFSAIPILVAVLNR